MASDSRPQRIVYIEDGPWRATIGPAFKKGLAAEGVSYEERADFDQLKEELRGGDLAEVYILDNEITGDTSQGAKLACQIKQRAQELGREVTIISLLCSNPDAVKEIYGSELSVLDIPVGYKLTEAPQVGFYAAACLKAGRQLNYQGWLREAGLIRPGSSVNEVVVQNGIMAQMEFVEGGFYSDPCGFVQTHLKQITEDMTPVTKRELERLFPVSVGKEAKE